MRGNKVTAYIAAVVTFAALLVSVPAMAFAAFTSSTAAPLTSTVAMLGTPVPGQDATTQCVMTGSGGSRKYTNVISIKPFGSASGATSYELLVYSPNKKLEGSGPGVPATGGTVTVVLTNGDAATGWTYVIKANRTFNATNTWTSLSATQTAPVTKTSCV
ncbi:hypothetical protein [Arthrobacter globiformis]|uniref:hypothetical protein n=1 Tax=Arthrobacter globiformis TaxID=1665 RepID=UPI0027926E89|nr:hypothetical protein [Arthrobacter globiformis]MDQ0620076.1 hypothetical protein [Arthrobacter globiformis]